MVYEFAEYGIWQQSVILAAAYSLRLITMLSPGKIIVYSP
jgi:hypothetical protein